MDASPIQQRLAWPITAKDVLGLARDAAIKPPHPNLEQCRPLAEILSGLASAELNASGGFILPYSERVPDKSKERKRKRDAINILMQVCDAAVLAHPPRKLRKGVDRRSLLPAGEPGYNGSRLDPRKGPLMILREALIDARHLILPDEEDPRTAILEIYEAVQTMFEACGRTRTKATRNSVVAIFIEKALTRIGIEGIERESVANFLSGK